MIFIIHSLKNIYNNGSVIMNNLKKDFPILQQSIHGKALIYLDSSASSQKPQCVIDAIAHYYENDHANIHRGIYALSVRATEQYEKVREKIKKMIHAKHNHEIIFVKGATEGVNLVAHSYGQKHFSANDEILVSTMEHHSNIVPWQLIADRCGAVIKVIPINDVGEIMLSEYEKLFSSKTKMVAVTHASNVLGTLNPIREMADMAHAHHVPIFVDGAQAFPHVPVDVEALDCDFYVISAHKAYGPTGIGVLYGKTDHLENMLPYQGGGDMIEQVSFERTTYNRLPHKFEAGTPPIGSVIGWGAAIDYLQQIGMAKVASHERNLRDDAEEKLRAVPDLKIIGTSKNKVGVISFVMKNNHPHDIATILDHEGIAVRAGHHCAMPLMKRFGIPACVRISFGIYNDISDVDALLEGLKEVQRVLT